MVHEFRDTLLGDRVEVDMPEALGLVAELQDKGDGDGVSHVGRFGRASTARDDAADAVEGVNDARPGVPFGRERAGILVGGNHWPLPRLHDLCA